MLERLAFGELPRKHHLALHGPGGALRYEECLTRKGFDGPYTILYHAERPQSLRAIDAALVELGRCRATKDRNALLAAKEALDRATADFAALRMDRGVARALTGRNIDALT